MRPLLVVALLVGSASCEKAKPSPAGGSADVGSGSAADCPADIGERVDTAMKATDVYFTQVDAVVAPWTATTDCEVMRAALDTLGPAGDEYVKVVEASKVWAKNLTEACRDRLDELYAPAAKSLEGKHRTIIDNGLANVKRCEAHPGMREAATRGIRLMRKKK